jgi:autotransporter-associated beta strand protein
MKTNTNPRSFRGLALALAALGFLGQPAAYAASYLDTDGATAGFQATNGATYGFSGSFWHSNSDGIGTLGVFTGGLVVGSVADEFAGQSFSIDTSNGTAFGSLTINSGTVTLIGTGNNNPGSTWTVAAGSTLNQNNTYGGNVGMNWQGTAVTFAGGGAININKMLGFNSGGRITQNGDSTLVVNLTKAGDPNYSGGYTLTTGTLNFAATPSATAFLGFASATKEFIINGGIIDNTSGTAMTLTVGAAGYKIGGDFAFTGSSDLNLGTAKMVLTGTRQITVTDKKLTVGGIISGSGYGLTKAGDGTLLLNGVNTYDGDTFVSTGTLGGTGTLSGAATFETGSKAVFTVTPGGGGNNSSKMTITGVMTYNANEVHLNLPANMPGGVYTLASSSATPVVNGAFPIPVVDSGSYAGDVTGATVSVVGNDLVLTAATTFAGPVKLAITQVNGGVDATAGAAFDVVVQAQNGSSVATHVSAATDVSLSLNTGTGTLNTPLIGTIPAGQNQITISGATYDKAESGVVLTATRTSGDTLTPANSAAFTVGPAAVAATNSTVTASPATVTANGSTPSTITVTLLDAFNNPVSGKDVALASDRGATDTISAPSSASNSSGVVTFTVTSATLGTATLSATADPSGTPLLINDTASVAFTNLVVGELQYNAGANPSPITVATPDLLEMTGVVATGEAKPARWHNGDFDDAGDLGYNDSPYVITYALDLTSNTAGYDIKEIRVFSKHDSSRSSQSYDVLYSLVGAPDTFLPLGTVLTAAGLDGAVMTRTYDISAGATPDSGIPILTGVAKIQFNIRPNGNGTVYREFDVTGTATGGGGTTYAAWALTNAPDQTPGEDYNNDGVENGVAYFMGATGLATNPGLNAGGTVTWPMDPAFSGSYEVQTSSDLGIWDNVTPRPEPSGGDLTYTLPPGLGKQFVRLLVTPAP